MCGKEQVPSMPFKNIWKWLVQIKTSNGSGTLILVRCITHILESEPFCIYWIHLDNPIWSGKNTDVTSNKWSDPLIRSTLITKSEPTTFISHRGAFLRQKATTVICGLMLQGLIRHRQIIILEISYCILHAYIFQYMFQ